MAIETDANTETLAGKGESKCLGKYEYGTKPWHIFMYAPEIYRADKAQLLNEVAAGLTVAFAQVSESVAFAFIAGVGPLLGLHAAWIIGLSLSFFGSRPGMINGATGVRAAVIAPYVAKHGTAYLFYIVLMISIFRFGRDVEIGQVCTIGTSQCNGWLRQWTSNNIGTGAIVYI